MTSSSESLTINTTYHLTFHMKYSIFNWSRVPRSVEHRFIVGDIANWNPRWDRHGGRCAVFVNTSANGAVGLETSSPSSLFMKDWKHYRSLCCSDLISKNKQIKTAISPRHFEIKNMKVEHMELKLTYRLLISRFICCLIRRIFYCDKEGKVQ